MIDYKCETCDAWMEDKICPIHNTKNFHANDYTTQNINIDVHNLHKSQAQVEVEGIHCEKCNQQYNTPVKQCSCGGDTLAFVVKDMLPGTTDPKALLVTATIKKQIRLKEINGEIICKR